VLARAVVVLGEDPIRSPRNPLQIRPGGVVLGDASAERLLLSNDADLACSVSGEAGYRR
jgi:hypothetical protein